MLETVAHKIKVVVMVPSPLTPRWLNNYCIDALSNEFEVEYWDCSAICALKFESAEKVDREYVFTINTLKELEDNLRRIPQDSVMISNIHPEADNYNVHRLIAKYNPYRVYFSFWSNTIDESLQFNNGKEKNLQSNEENITSKHESLFRRVKHALYKNRAFLYISKFIRFKGDHRFKQFASTEKQMRMVRKNLSLYKGEFVIDVLPNKEFSINHPDYEKYLTIQRADAKPIVKGRYVVFLDSFFPYHPHLRTEDPRVDFNALVQPYFASLNSFFDKIEQYYQCEVVVAGHPSAQFIETNPYGKRKVFYNKSAELVKDSIGVCLHASYSIAFAILFDKPVCLMTNEALRKASNPRATLAAYSKVFHQPIVDTDTCKEAGSALTPFDPKIRQGYIDTFFDTKNNKLNAELVPIHINKIHEYIVAKMAEQN